MSRFQTTAALTAVALLAYSLGAGRTPEPQAAAAPVVVHADADELARLSALVADLEAARDKDRAAILTLEEQLAVAKAAPKSNCESGLCPTCQCPGDGRCAKGECATTSQPVVTYAACSTGQCATYQPTRRFRIFGRRR